MRNIFNIMKNRLKLKLKKKSSIIVYILSPIIAVLVALVFNNIGQSNIKVGIYDGDASEISKALVSEIKSNERFTVVNVQKEYINSLVSKGRIDVVIEIPEGFQKDMIDVKSPKVGLFTQKDSSVTVWVENSINYFNAALEDMARAAEGSEETFFKIYENFKDSKVEISNHNLDDKTRNIGVSVQSIGLLLVFMFAGATLTSSTILSDKMMRTYQRMRTSPMRKIEYISGNVLASLTINVVQIGIILLLSKTFLLKFYTSSWIVFVILLAFSAVAVGLGLLIASVAKSSSQAGQFGNLIILPTCMLSGCFWPAYLMPEIMQNIAKIFPQWWILKSFSDLQEGKTFVDILPYLGVVVGIAIILFAVALFNMRTKDDTKGFI